MIAGTLNIIYGIGALDSANIYANDTRFILTNLNTLGWVLIILGRDPADRRLLTDLRQYIRPGHRDHCRDFGAIGALLSIGGSDPWWSLAIFFLCVWIVYGIVVLGEDERVPTT